MIIKPRSLLLAFCVLLATLALPAFAKEGDKAPTLPTMELKIGGQTVHAEVAVTDETRQKGLMFREKLGKNDGMLFVFSQVAYHAMWMRNTPLPLSVAFMDEHGKILSIHEMQPHTENSHQAAGPARYALEMNAGWFASYRIKAGDVVKGLEKAPKGR
jgi:hypothetical protein